MTAATIGHALSVAEARLSGAGCATPRLDARVLLSHVLGLDPAGLLTRRDDPLASKDADAFDALVTRRADREPVAHLTGIKGFWEHDFVVSADVLTPRPDSETIIEAALDHIPVNMDARILDLGTGSGCLLLSILAARRHTTGMGIDTSMPALVIARRNAKQLCLDDRVQFENRSFTDPPDGPFDLIVANPPYVPAADIDGLEPEIAFEPRAALDGGADGLDAYRAIAPHVANRLVPGGVIVLEVGAGQADAVTNLMCDAGLSVGALRHDLAGIARCVVATAS